MSLPVLYSFRRCPYAMRARMAIARSGITVVLREVELRRPPDEMLLASPKGTVPVLVLPGGEVIDESVDIMYWVLRKNDADGWLDASCQQDCDALVRENDGDFKIHLDHYKYADRYPEFSAGKYRDDARPFLNTLEARLQENRFLCADRVTFADIAIFPFIRQFSMVDQHYFDGLPLPRLQRWLAYLLSLDLFALVMHKFPIWQAGDNLIHFPPGAGETHRV